MDGSSVVKTCLRAVGDQPVAALHEEGQEAGAVVARLFEEHGAGPLRYLGRRAGGAAAEDLVGDTFTVVIEQLGGFDPARGAERAWLYGIATTCAARTAATPQPSAPAVPRSVFTSSTTTWPRGSTHSDACATSPQPSQPSAMRNATCCS